MTITETTTENLFAKAHEALTSQRWAEARVLLDSLSRRRDNAWCLCDASAYGAPLSMQVLLDDRITLINSQVL